MPSFYRSTPSNTRYNLFFRKMKKTGLPSQPRTEETTGLTSPKQAE